MAEDQGGERSDLSRMPWLKIFGAFKIALDPKKLLLAGAGIVVMSLGWWLLAYVFYSLRSMPQVDDYLTNLVKEQTQTEQKEAWKSFKEAREAWNLLHQLAGPVPASPKEAVRQDAADLAKDLPEFNQLGNLVQGFQRYQAPVKIKLGTDSGNALEIGNNSYSFTADKGALAELEKLKDGQVTAGQLDIRDVKAGKAKVAGIDITLDKAKQAEEAQQYLQGVRSPAQVRLEVQNDPGRKELEKKALALFEETTPIKPFGKLRSWPWCEYRGPNPYLLVTGDTRVARTDGLLNWFLTVQLPVVLEPLCKFLEPVKSLFKPAAAGWNRMYLFLAILWMLLTWGLFGGAITRMAAVQAARQSEKIGMLEALRFARSRLQSYFFAPLFPLFFLAGITVLLIVFGWFEGFTWAFGDILVAGFLWPLVLIAGLVMAAILVGLVGWPLMYATISSEGSDSFDAISRSYSYVYQAPFQYLWYALVALVYGGILIFFVGFMGSMLVYMGKWGVSSAPLVPKDREPSYLFVCAPTSFGWRDLLLSQSTQIEVQPRVLPTGEISHGYGFNKAYEETFSWNNRAGAFLVMIWLGLLFLMIVGFGYSYFWTAGTIIYLLLRHKVDDTEMDEIHLEDEEEEVFTPVSPEGAAAGGDSPAGGVTMVEAPQLRPGGESPGAAPSEGSGEAPPQPPPASDNPSP